MSKTNQPPEETWEERFDDKFVFHANEGDVWQKRWKQFPGPKDEANERNHVRKLKHFLTQALAEERRKMEGEIERMKKKKTADRELNTWDGKTEQIKYYENDSDVGYNKAIADILDYLTPTGEKE